MLTLITLAIDNSYSKVSGLTAPQEKELRGRLSYVVGGKSAFFSGYGPQRRSLLSKRGDFPTGLLEEVYSFFADNKLTWGMLIEKRFKPFSQTLQRALTAKPYPWQVEATQMAISHARGIISAPTGTGKSLAMALLVSELNMPTLIVVPSLEIKKQLQESFVNLGVDNVTIENIDSPTLDTPSYFDCLIIDEAHHVAAKTYHKLNKTAWNKIYHRYFFTATPFRNDSEETLLFKAIAGSILYQLSYADAVDNGYIVPVDAYYIEIPKQYTCAFTYAQVYKELVVENTIRNGIISRLLVNLQQSSIATLCLVREVQHGETLSALTGIPFVSGEDEASRDYIRQFNTGEIKVLIGTTGILGEGIDTKPCEYVVIAGLGKAKSQFMQQVGRAVRTFPGKNSAKVIIFKDTSHKFLIRHYNAQRVILKSEYGVLCHKLEA